MKIYFNTLVLIFGVILASQSVCLSQETAPENVYTSPDSPIARMEKPGLLVVLPAGEALATKLATELNALNAADKTFRAIQCAVAFGPCGDSVANAVDALEAQGCDGIVAVPMLTLPSYVTKFTLPALLGVYASEAQRAELAKLALTPARADVPVVMLASLSEEGVLTRFVAAEAAKLSTAPAQERVLLLATYSKDLEGYTKKILKETLAEVVEEAGFDKADLAMVARDDGDFVRNVVEPIVKKNAEDGKKTLVVGAYFSASAKTCLNGALPQDAQCVESESCVERCDKLSEYVFEIAKEARLY